MANFDVKNRFRSYACSIVFGFVGLFVFDIAKGTLGVENKALISKSLDAAQDQAKELLSNPLPGQLLGETKEGAIKRFHQDCSSAVELIQLSASMRSDDDEKGLNMLALMLVNDMIQTEKTNPSFSENDFATLERCLQVYNIAALDDAVDNLKSIMGPPAVAQQQEQIGYVRWLEFGPATDGSKNYTVLTDSSLFGHTPIGKVLNSPPDPGKDHVPQLRTWDDIFVDKPPKFSSFVANTDIYLRRDPPTQLDGHGAVTLTDTLGIIKQEQAVEPITSDEKGPFLIYGPNDKGNIAVWVHVRVPATGK